MSIGSICRIDNAGDQHWYTSDGKTLHREDGPAVVESDGYEEWRINGVLHRVGGPAQTNADGSKWWLQNGIYHREDGPAVILSDGTIEWYIRGKKVDPILHFILRGQNIG